MVGKFTIDSLKKNRPNTKIITKCIWKNSNDKLNFFSSDNGVLSTLEDLQRSSPKQFLVYNTIKKASPNYLRVATLKDISSNPISICKALQNKGYIDLFKKSGEHLGDKIAFSSIKKKIIYNKEQIEVIDNIKSSLKLKKFSSNLLHGVTGSGKTEIFIESIKTVMAMGKSSIVLIPEISLTPQIAGRFKDVFGEGIALWHSQLTKAQRAKTWDSINTGESKIVIGARSAIFSPIKNLGLIIVDEEHDASYKQESPSPRYHARDVAIMRGKIENCSVVLSSATPSLETFYNYKVKKHKNTSIELHFEETILNNLYFFEAGSPISISNTSNGGYAFVSKPKSRCSNCMRCICFSVSTIPKEAQMVQDASRCFKIPEVRSNFVEVV